MWDNPETVTALVGEHLARRPAMRLADVYKLLYQGVRGSEHLLAAPDEFAACLLAEYQAVPADGAEPLLEPIRPNQSLFRVNLRPYKARDGDVDALAAACLEAARCTWGTPCDLRQAWSTFVHLCQAELPVAFPPDDVAAFSRWLDEQAYPAVHHSDPYRALYRPAYRLVGWRSPIVQRLHV